MGAGDRPGGLISFAVLLALNATLTLPGIAGFVLAVGMGRGCQRVGLRAHQGGTRWRRSVRTAPRNGFARAWTAIVDSNTTTVLAGVLLFFYATGAVRGFGITLTVGVAASMFTALVLTRLLVETAVGSFRLTRRPRLLGLEVGAGLRRRLELRPPQLLRHSRRWLALSAVVVVIAVAGVVTRGLDYGIEFSGGRLVE